MEPIAIHPLKGPIQKAIFLPGSKSITNRALLLAALGTGDCTLQDALFSEDTLCMVEGLRALGFKIEANCTQRTFQVQGMQGLIPNNEAKLYVGNAGTVARFLLAACVLCPHGSFYFSGSPEMHTRPIEPLIQALSKLAKISVQYHQTPGHFPLTLKTFGIHGGSTTVNTEVSSQFLSACLLLLPWIRKKIELRWDPSICVSAPFIDMTQKMLCNFGHTNAFTVEEKNGIAYNHPNVLSKDTPLIYKIEPDLTAASLFFTLSLVTGSTFTFPGVNLHNTLQGDSAFLTLLEPFGLSWEQKSDALCVYPHFPSVKLPKQTLDFSAISDTFITLAAIAPKLGQPLHIIGIGHTRKQESDRLEVTAAALKMLGQEVRCTQNTLSIEPRPLKYPVTIDPKKDHRIAMSFAILAHCTLKEYPSMPWLFIKNPQCVEKTYPDFFKTLQSLHQPVD